MLKTASAKLNNALFSSIGLLILRWVGAGMLIYGHGAVKITHMVHGHFGFGNPIGIGVVPSLILAAFAESICAFFVAIGLYTRIASFILMIDLFVAYFVSFDESALLYLIIFIMTFFAGPGRFSFDYLRK